MEQGFGSGMDRKTGVLGRMKSHLERNRLGELLVLSGRLSPHDLRTALARQAELKRPLGHVLLELGMIRRRDIASAMAAQWAMRGTMTLVTAMIAFSAFSPRSAQAAEPAAAAATSVAALSSYPSLFGTGEKKSADLKAFTKWSAMFARFDRQMAANDSPDAMRRWKADLDRIKGQPLDRMVEQVNAMANRMRYIGDDKNWGKSDYWETPVEFFTRGGDCEDFAIAKYASLRALGVPDSRMRLAIVRDTQKGIPHAILIVYTDTGAKILDNQIKTVESDRQVAHYKPIFSINRSAWWLHTAPTSMQVASR
jgi:predicted transglutaminase-like cysteine proteinase